ncbi:MAG TPA: type II secretion system F family protein [Bacteroidales bacterium]|nr:type II secretion system F family protein [Bacteroidales bacterium]
MEGDVLMPLFKCTVLNTLGEKEVVYLEAVDDVVLKAELRQNKMHALKIKVVKEKKENEFLALSSKVKADEFTNFLRQFAVMVNAGIPISDCMNSLRSQRFSKPLRVVLQKIYYDIESGILLSEAFEKHPKVFPSFFVSMVAIGEVSGSLDNVLLSMADYYENDRKIKKKAKSAMVYPTVLLVLVFAVLVFVMLFILPSFESTINELGGEVPTITRVMMSISHFIQNKIYIIIPVIVVVFIAIKLFFKTKKGKYIRDYLLFRLPIVGKVQRNLITSRFAKAFAILLGSGMNLIDCLENLKKMLGNEVFSRKFNFTIEEVKRGRRLAPSIEATKLFPSILTEMINVGEETGNIEDVLVATSSYFDELVESSISKAIASLEPVMIIAIGGIVAIVILSVLVPIISLMGSI